MFYERLVYPLPNEHLFGFLEHMIQIPQFFFLFPGINRESLGNKTPYCANTPSNVIHAD